jgi:hypothetical protein
VVVHMDVKNIKISFSAVYIVEFEIEETISKPSETD